MTKAAINAIVADPIKRAALARRFWPKVSVRDPHECWPWVARAKHPHGYGRMTAGRGVHIKAHHVAYALRHGSVPESKMVCHHCDNPCCCNPNHYFLGSAADNMRDAKNKGRSSPPPHSFGERHHATKFDTATALRIKNDARSARVVAAENCICEMTVYRLRKGKTWAKLQGTQP